MAVPIASILLLVYIGYSLLTGGSSKEKYLSFLVIATVMAIAMPQGYLLMIGDTELFSLKKVSGLMCLLYGMYYIFKYRMHLSQQFVFRSYLLIISVFVGVFVALIYPYTEPIIPTLPEYSWDSYIIGEQAKTVASLEVGNALRLFMGIVIFLGIVATVKVICNDADLLKVLKKIIIYSQPFAYYGVFEFVAKNILGDLKLTHTINAVVFGLGRSTYTDAFLKGGDLYVLQGVTREPSHFIISMFFIALSILVWNKIQTVRFNRTSSLFYYVYLFLLLVLMILSGGFSAWWCIFILGLVYFALKYDTYKKTLGESVPYIILSLLIISAIGGCMIFLFGTELEYAITRAENAIYTINALATSGALVAVGAEGELSTFARLTSIFDVTANFMDRPLLGLGLGFQLAHAAFPTMLSDLGVLGTILWVRVLASSMGEVRHHYDFIFLGLIMIVWGTFLGVVTQYVEMYVLILFECTRLYTAVK